MTEKEIRELRRRFRPDKENFSLIHGCFVNDNHQIISKFDESLSSMPQEDAERYLGLLKKSISGTIGKNLVDISFTNEQVVDSSEHRLLSALRKSQLNDEAALQTFYDRIIEKLTMKGSYLILIAHDTYAVPYRAKDDTIQNDASDEEFCYIVCGICPVKQSQPALSYFSLENRFRSGNQYQTVSAPAIGFLFPAFDDRSANIYNALYYSHSTAENHQEFIDAIFNVQSPMPAAVQKETFEAVLSDSLCDECKLEVVQAVHEQLFDMVEAHKQSKEAEPLTISKKEVGAILESCGISNERVDEFEKQFDERFGDDALIPPTNVVDCKRFELKTPDVVIKVNPERSDLIETKIINGSKYILICANDGVEVNGVNVSIKSDS